jgi:hypothetical protein
VSNLYDQFSDWSDKRDIIYISCYLFYGPRGFDCFGRYRDRFTR